MDVADRAKARVQAILNRVRDLTKQGLTDEAEVVRKSLRPLAWKIAAKSATLDPTRRAGRHTFLWLAPSLCKKPRHSQAQTPVCP